VQTLGKLVDPEVIAALVAAFLVFFTSIFMEHRRRVHEAIAIAAGVKAEIKVVADVLHQMDIVEDFIFAYRNPRIYDQRLWADESRKENYFAFYDAIASKIGMLPGGLAKEVVKFYGYSRVSRDATVPFSRNASRKMTPNAARKSAESVLFAIRNSLLAAELVLSYQQKYFFSLGEIEKVDSKAVALLLCRIDSVLSGKRCPAHP